MSVSSWLRDRSTCRARDSRPKAIALVAILFQKTGTAVVGIAGIVILVSVSFQAGTPGPEDSPGSGIVVRTELAALWNPPGPSRCGPTRGRRNRLPLTGGTAHRAETPWAE